MSSLVDDWTLEDGYKQLVQAWAAGVVSVLLAFCFCARKARNERAMIRRVMVLMRATCYLLIACQTPLVLAAFYLDDPLTDSFEDGLGRPVCGIVAGLTGLFTNSAAGIRWTFLGAMPALMYLDAWAQVETFDLVVCRDAGDCATGDGVPTDLLRVILVRDLLAMIAEIWGFVLVFFLCWSIGWFRPRYNLRLLASSYEFGQLPANYTHRRV